MPIIGKNGIGGWELGIGTLGHWKLEHWKLEHWELGREKGVAPLFPWFSCFFRLTG